MKKVSGYIDVRALGCYDFEFYVDDNTTKEEIITLWDTKFKTSGKDGLNGYTNEKEKLIAFYGDEKAESKRPYIRGYFTKDNK